VRAVRLRLLVLFAVTVLAVATAAADAASGLRTSLLGQTHTPLAGSPWAYYLRAWGPDRKPWHGAIIIEVVTTKGKKLDGIGQFAFNGSWLHAYIWRRPDRGQTLDLRITFVEGTTKVDTASYRVSVK
jgi:hypothetical protein